VIGYCLGGLLTSLTAARSTVGASVAFHGGDTEKYLGEADAIRTPFLMHLADDDDDDEFLPPPAQSASRDALSNNTNVQIFGYPRFRHAFSRQDGAHYDAAAAATLANHRTWSSL
jgi:carboxymethylenebutenolidase